MSDPRQRHLRTRLYLAASLLAASGSVWSQNETNGFPVNARARFRVSILLARPQRKHPTKKTVVEAR